MKIKGNGAVRQVKKKDGTPVKNSWQLIVSQGYDPITGKRIQRTRHFRGTKTEARRALADLVREIESGIKFDSDKILFREYSKQWLEARKASGRYSASTIKRNTQIQEVLNSYLGSILLRDIDAPVIRNLYIELHKKGLKESTVNKYAVQLNQILGQALRDGVILQNPCQLVDSPKQLKSTIGKTLTQAEVARLVKMLDGLASKSYPLEGEARQKATSNKCRSAVIKLILATGMRRGEVLALTWERVNTDLGIIEVRNSLDELDGELKAPKTPNSIRDITIDQATLTMLKQWRQDQKNYLNTLGIEQGQDTPVFTSEAGGYINGHNFNRWWKNFIKGTDFEGLRIHDLRHTHATLLVSSGLNIKAVSARLGHANIGITLDLYAHAQREDDIKAARIVGELLRS